jgi:hypothetical protein
VRRSFVEAVAQAIGAFGLHVVVGVLDIRTAIVDVSYAYAVRLQAIVQEIVPEGCPNR